MEMDIEELKRKMQLNFLVKNQSVHTDISAAAAMGDIKLAHRLAHSLKGNAGMIGKMELKNAAAEVEVLLRDGTAAVWESKMHNLKNQLMPVLEELKSMFDADNEKPGAEK